MSDIIRLENEKFNVKTRVSYSNEFLNVPIKMWVGEIENDTMEQFYNLARLPFAFKHVAAMPDTHLGYGMPIGGVLATKGYVIPNAVGVDIGCGMLCVRTDRRHINRRTLKKIVDDIKKLIPVGFKHHKKPQGRLPIWDKQIMTSIVENEWESAEKQLGTLGGGNHFIEIQKGDDGFIYVMIHSGSRNLGKKIADHYNKLAQTKNEDWCSSVPKKWQLAFLPIIHQHGRAYMYEMNYAVRFAYANRMLMMEKVQEAFANHVDATFYDKCAINIAHNYARVEHHFGENVVVHRKGATSAYKDELGIIPGSQGTCSYIVRGKGNPESFMSCSHGAGRLMGRKQAQRSLSLEKEVKKLDDQGIIHGIKKAKDLDEASGAYKDIDEVMENQKNLVDIETKLRPLAVVKG